MKRRRRLVVPLLFAIALLGAYAFLRVTPALATQIPYHARITDILLFLACVPAILFGVRLVDLVLFDIVTARRATVQAPQLLREIVAIALYAVAFALAVWQIFDYDIRTVLATGTIIAAVLGLALQETLGNLFAGIALHAEDSFGPGDVIRSGEYFGTVEAVRWRGTRLRTFNNNLVIVPNSMLARERVEVYPRRNLNARVLQVGIDYNVPPAIVLNVLVQAVSNIEGISHEMPAFARVGGFGDSAVIYEIKYFMHDYAQRDRIDADIRKAVWYALRRNNISIPYPIRTLARYQAPATRQQPDTREILHRLERVDILTPLSRAAQEAISEAARVHVYSRGETILRQGTAGDSMFIVHEGAVGVRVDDEEVARLQPGEFFGEMALLTGEARAADIVALTDVVAVEITKDALEPVVHDHPELANAISAKIELRRGDLDARGSRDEVQQSVLARIRNWFGL